MIRSYLIGIGLTTTLTFVAWLLVLFYFDPNSSGMVGLVLFFVSLTATLIGLATLILYTIRKYFSDNVLAIFNISLRQGVILGLVVSGLLLLRTLGVVAWWNVGMLVLAGIVMEIYFRVK